MIIGSLDRPPLLLPISPVRVMSPSRRSSSYHTIHTYWYSTNDSTKKIMSEPVANPPKAVFHFYIERASVSQPFYSIALQVPVAVKVLLHGITTQKRWTELVARTRRGSQISLGHRLLQFMLILATRPSHLISILSRRYQKKKKD